MGKFLGSPQTTLCSEYVGLPILESKRRGTRSSHEAISDALLSCLMDKFGRRLAIIRGNVGIIAAVLGQSFCKTAIQFLGTRLVLGFFCLFNSISSTVLLAELAHSEHRAVSSALLNKRFLPRFHHCCMDLVWVP